MPATYTLIASNTLGSSAASVAFSNIPDTYTDLLVKFSARSTRSGELKDNIGLRFNTDTASVTVYSSTMLSAIGTTVNSTRVSNNDAIESEFITAASATSNTFAPGEFYIPNYLASSNKPLSSYAAAIFNNATEMRMDNLAGLWRNTNAINKITIFSEFSFVTNSSFWLYGIKKD